MSDAEEKQPATIVLTFDPPIHFNGKDYTEVTLREPTSQQFADAMDLGGVRSAIHLVHVVGKLPQAVAQLLPISKTLEADRFFSRFTVPGQRT
ncbi:phage tail assembly protein [Roseomonas xinghualingensis]|uniref:phage tail assembly protein n=1 Tax=Roseomonas xinghualingensis TaxID=2986475 RepID=UPI0021F17D21|nr:phage tail assembly protein [Roseomonas sp. SXEYE001]MCV4207572.1 phage tail assembly protein [Roseomonas sp. SXEYE001]